MPISRRGRRRSAALASIAAFTAGAVFVAAAPASADTAALATKAAQAAAVIEKATGTADLVSGAFLPDGSVRATVSSESGPTAITVPSGGDGVIKATSGDGPQVGIHLPGSSGAAVPSGAGTVVFPDAGRATDLGVQPTEDGVRTLVTLKDASAPTEYRFPLDLPAGATTEQLEDDSILVAQGEDIIGALDVPWAKDANGTEVPTDYRIEGNTLVQTIRPQQATAFPVVADPFWLIPAAIVLGRVLLAQGVKSISKHAAQRMAVRGISKNMVVNTVKNGKKTRGNTRGTWKYKSGKIWVVVNSKGNVVSVGRN